MVEKRIAELDALRGLAAFTVLINHCLMPYKNIYSLFITHDPQKSNTSLNYIMFSPFHIFWNGHSAVILFFILSGFVLSATHYSRTPFVYKNYLIKRLCRLYIPYFTIVTMSVILVNVYHKEHGMSNLSDWFNIMWQDKVSFIDYLRLVFLTGNTNNVGTTLWTIIIEIEVSIVLPIFILIIKNLSFLKNILFVITYLLMFYILGKTSIFIYIPFLRNFYYLTFFLFGSIIYKYRNRAIENYRNTNILFAVLIAITIVLYNWEWLFVWVRPYNNSSTNHIINDYIIAAGGCILIMLCLLKIPIVESTLNHYAFKFLGKISYSLYLVHPIILLCIVYTFKSVEYSYLFPIVVLSSIIISYLYYLTIENPSIRLGKYLTNKPIGQ